LKLCGSTKHGLTLIKKVDLHILLTSLYKADDDDNDDDNDDITVFDFVYTTAVKLSGGVTARWRQ